MKIDVIIKNLMTNSIVENKFSLTEFRYSTYFGPNPIFIPSYLIYYAAFSSASLLTKLNLVMTRIHDPLTFRDFAKYAENRYIP